MPILTQKDFTQWVEFRKVAQPDQSYLEIILDACNTFEVEYESVRPLLSDQVISKLEAEARAAKLLKEKVKSHTLDGFF